MSPSLHAPLRIGTRASLLALAQAQLALGCLRKRFPDDPAAQNAIFVPVTTTGDRLKGLPLSEMGGKGLFARELEQALQANKIDFAVHSLKDMETVLPPGLMLGAFLEREDARDVMLSVKALSFDTLPGGSVVGTCAPRRIAQILHHRPDLVCIPLRGNVESRIGKLNDGQTDAIILSLPALRW